MKRAKPELKKALDDGKLSFTAEELETMVVGEHDWAVADLRRGADIRGTHPSIGYFWEALGELDAQEKALFCRFAWGRSRLPAGCRGVKIIIESTHVHGDPDEHLPVVHTPLSEQSSSLEHEATAVTARG